MTEKSESSDRPESPCIMFPSLEDAPEIIPSFIGDDSEFHEIIFHDTYMINLRTGDFLIPPHSQDIFHIAERFVSENKPFLTLDSSDLSPDLLSLMSISWHHHHRVYVNLDLNVLSRLSEIMEGEKACPPDNPKDPNDRKGYERRWALMSLLSLTYLNSSISYEILIPEFASKNGISRTDHLLSNIDSILKMKGHDIMAGLLNGEFHPDFVKQEHSFPYSITESTAGGRFIGNYRNMLELARRIREGESYPRGSLHLENYMVWLHDNSFRSTAAIFTAMYVFADHNPRSVMKKIRSSKGSGLLEIVVNQAWDCTHVMNFFNPEAIEGRHLPGEEYITLFITRDAALRSIINSVHDAFFNNINPFSNHFGSKDSDHIYSLYKELFDNEKSPDRSYNKESYHYDEAESIKELELNLVGECGYIESIPFSLPSERRS